MSAPTRVLAWGQAEALNHEYGPLGALHTFLKRLMQKIIQFFKEVKLELRKVTWPGRDEVIKSTIVVLIAIAILGVFLWVIDLILQGVVGQLMK